MSILFWRSAVKPRRSPILHKIGILLLHTSAAASPVGTTTGLYGIRHLKTPKGFQRFADDAIERYTEKIRSSSGSSLCNTLLNCSLIQCFSRSGELVTYISSMPSSPEIIRAMDEISDTVCSKVLTSNFLFSLHLRLFCLTFFFVFVFVFVVFRLVGLYCNGLRGVL